jgi:hypothetical protein
VAQTGDVIQLLQFRKLTVEAPPADDVGGPLLADRFTDGLEQSLVAGVEVDLASQ